MGGQDGCLTIPSVVLVVLLFMNEFVNLEQVAVAGIMICGFAAFLMLVILMWRHLVDSWSLLCLILRESPYRMAGLLLLVARNSLVRGWVRDHKCERAAVKTWLFYLPSLFVVIWGVVVLVLVNSILPFRIALILAVAFSLTWLQDYNHIYFEHPPQSPDWPIFIAVEKEMQLERRLARIERRIDIRQRREEPERQIGVHQRREKAEA